MDKGDGKVKYVLSGEGATSIFTIDENTGDIHATKRLDREAQAYYTLQAQAVDRLTNLPVEPRSEFVVKVQDINDNEPKFAEGPYLAGVPEMSPLGKRLVPPCPTLSHLSAEAVGSVGICTCTCGFRVRRAPSAPPLPYFQALLPSFHC